MRCNYMVLLVAAALFSSGNAAMTTTDSRLSIRDQADTPSHRTLRIHTKPTDNEEERGLFGKTIPKPLLSTEEINLLAKEGTSADDVFKKLELDKLVKLDDKLNIVDNGLKQALVNPNLMQFSKYLEKINGKNPPEAMVLALSKQYGDEAVAKMLFDAKKKYNGVTKAVAENLQAAQYVKWYNEKKTTDDVFYLLDLHHKTWYDDAYVQIWWEFVNVRAALVSKGI